MVEVDSITALRQLNIETLNRLRDVVSMVDQSLYTHLNLKGRASIGQHVRHTLEFYLRLFQDGTEVNYDNRKRDILIESASNHAVVVIDEIIQSLHGLNQDFVITLKADFPSVSVQSVSVSSSLSRELLYVLEHAIHHMALIRILIKDEDFSFELPDSFGVAYSTLAYNSSEANG